ncbi:STAS domain-containing protein [Cereibacter sphaeroides]|uniref:STAS domain-containing protein n=1 Tax=Cereibacter sphaeroides TaxID=1063 RepID=UPI001F2A0A6C|nr:STAS domain-containing protein [Cereibacter sphaeroides]MCE6961511.1 STAS domain-containing protein [Cereibacter sphaeroides]MCE6967826.1 STAS domain-containing protein [Cereibacter sphaeroides]MCE6972586.1 STAS domain-containing protein [Cereibacter sphaeroides]
MPAEPVLVTLPERAGLPEAPSLARDLASALATSQPVRVETAPAREIGLPILQLLLAAHRQAARDGLRFDVTVPPGGALAETMAAHGLAAQASPVTIAAGLWTGLEPAGARR